MLKSMTGFARREGALGQSNWFWEIRTVNGRGLEVRLRLPQGYESLEPQVRELCKQHFTRGSCFVTLSVKNEQGRVSLKLNEAALEQVVAAAKKASELLSAGAPSVDGLLGIRGVLEPVEDAEDENQRAEREAAIVLDLSRALEQVRGARAEEGAHLTRIIAEHVDGVERLIDEAENAPARTPEAIRDNLRDQILRLVNEAPQLDQQRLYQEAVLIAAKADIREELDRLRAHVSAARELLGSQEPVGRRFEFLAQEMNREANTVCSKSNDVTISQAGLGLKTVIDRLREQVQNIE